MTIVRGADHRPARVTFSVGNWIALGAIAVGPAGAAVGLLWKMDNRLTKIEQTVQSLADGQIADHQRRIERLEAGRFSGN